MVAIEGTRSKKKKKFFSLFLSLSLSLSLCFSLFQHNIVKQHRRKEQQPQACLLVLSNHPAILPADQLNSLLVHEQFSPSSYFFLRGKEYLPSMFMDTLQGYNHTNLPPPMPPSKTILLSIQRKSMTKDISWVLDPGRPVLAVYFSFFESRSPAVAIVFFFPSQPISPFLRSVFFSLSLSLLGQDLAVL